MHAHRKKVANSFRLAALLTVLLLAFVVWRRSVMLSVIARKSASGSSSEQPAVRRLPPLQHLAADEPRFVLNQTANRYPTIIEFLNKTEGYYGGVGFRAVSLVTPRAHLLFGLLSPEECTEMVKVAADQMARSEVVHRPGESAVNTVRTSFGMFILRPVPADIKLRKRIAAFAGVPVVNLEATQVLRYHPGQYYKLHPDYFYPDAREHLARGGQRFATVLTWLNHIEEGGETRFGIAQPKPITLKQTGVGDAIMFYSMTADGQIDPASNHEAIPPVNGSMKWVAVTWIRQHEFR